jgi:hypothetical protein
MSSTEITDPSRELEQTRQRLEAWRSGRPASGRVAGSSLLEPTRATRRVWRRDRHHVQGVRDGVQVTPGEMQIDHGVFELDVTKQQLNGSQVGPSRAGVWRTNVTGCAPRPASQAGRGRGGLARIPDDFGGDRLVGAPAGDGPWKQPRLRLHPTPVRAQRIEQRRAERDTSIAPSLALPECESASLDCRCPSPVGSASPRSACPSNRAPSTSCGR